MPVDENPFSCFHYNRDSELWGHKESKAYESILDAYGWDCMVNNNTEAKKLSASWLV